MRPSLQICLVLNPRYLSILSTSPSLWLVAPGQGSGELEDQRSGGAPPYNRRGHVSELVGDPCLRLGLSIPIRG